ncbi:MAG: efflux RND transporter periplasmic adaptor subunit [Desulfobacter sp.]
MNQKTTSSLAVKILRVLLPLLLILAGAGGFNYFRSKEIKIERRPPKKQAAVVNVMEMQPGTFQSTVQAMGTVTPDRQVVVKSKVAGEVVSVSPDFVVGGLMKKGQTLLNIEDIDYRIDVAKASSALDTAVSDLEIERGSQQIAREELKLIRQADLGDVEETDLALRKPQRIQAEAAVKSARADLESAKLDLKRTRVTLPFNALVREKHVDAGALLPAQGDIATLVDVDRFQVEALVPPDKLGTITAGSASASRALVRSRYANQTWEGRVARFTGTVSANSRMAGVIILVEDPLGLSREQGNGQLLLDDYVDVAIMSQKLDQVFAVSRSHLRDNDTVWIYNNGRLDIRAVAFAWKEDGTVYIRSGIRAGDRLITSDLPAPVQGMALQIDAEGRS